MRLLALHGLGSSGSLLKTQLVGIMRELGPDYSLTFLDGAVPCGRGPGIPPGVSGPFFSYVSSFTPAGMSECLDTLERFIEAEGPFDGIVGFSMGAAVAISYILHHQRTNPDDRPPFSFAFLLSPIFAVSPDEDWCRDVVQQITSCHEFAAFRSVFPNAGCAPAMAAGDSSAARTFADYLRQVALMGRTMNSDDELYPVFKSFDTAGAADVPRLFHPHLVEDRIAIPIVFVSGSNDWPDISAQSQVARGLCSPALTTVYSHAGGHEIPSGRDDVVAIVGLVKEAAREGQSLSDLYDF